MLVVKCCAAVIGLGGAVALVIAGQTEAPGKLEPAAASHREEVPEPSRAQIVRLSSEFDLPLVLPTVLPAGFDWADQIRVGAEDGRHAEFRTVMYFNDQSGESVLTCIARTAEPCEPAPDDVIAKHEGLTVAIRFFTEVSPGARAEWQATSFSGNFDRVPWLS